MLNYELVVHICFISTIVTLLWIVFSPRSIYERIKLYMYIFMAVTIIMVGLCMIASYNNPYEFESICNLVDQGSDEQYIEDNGCHIPLGEKLVESSLVNRYCFEKYKQREKYMIFWFTDSWRKIRYEFKPIEQSEYVIISPLEPIKKE